MTTFQFILITALAASVAAYKEYAPIRCYHGYSCELPCPEAKLTTNITAVYWKRCDYTTFICRFVFYLAPTHFTSYNISNNFYIDEDGIFDEHVNLTIRNTTIEEHKYFYRCSVKGTTYQEGLDVVYLKVLCKYEKCNSSLCH